MNAPLPMDDADLARADAYALLANLFFAAPNTALLNSLHQMGRPAEEGEDAMTTSWNALCAAAQDAPAIAAEYDALFVSVGKPLVALYASWYLTGFLMEKPLALLRDDLAVFGLARQHEKHDAEDHIAGELEVMRHLLMRGDLAGQQAFFQRHLQPWYGALCTALESVDDARFSHGFYSNVARFMRAFLDMERDYFRLQQPMEV